jgi:hypothetical protein
MKTKSSVDVEWVCIAPGKVVVATADRTWLHQLKPTDKSDRFARPMVGTGSVATTRNLLDGAIAAAKLSIPSNHRSPALTPLRWVWRMAGAYQVARVTPALMEEASQRFALSGHEKLAEWATQKAQEERGHDLLALRDIQSMGYQAQELVKAIVPSAAMTLVEYFTRSVQNPDPIDCVGYSYMLERLSLRVGEEYIQRIEALFPPEINATRCLRVHSSVGSDTEHAEETIEMVAGLSERERSRIALACYETALLSFCPPKEGYLSEEQLQQLLKPFKLEDS